MRSAHRHSLKFGFAYLMAIISFLTGPRSSAQATVNPMEEAASSISDAISHAKLPTVAVFDFSGPNDNLTQLGLDLAASFRTLLAKTGSRFQVEDLQRMNQALANLSYAPEIILSPDSLLAAAQDLSVSGLVVGKFSFVGDRITVDISAYRSKDGKGIRSMKVSWPLSEDMRKLSVMGLGEEKDWEGAQIPRPGVAGYTFPKCLDCPAAKYSNEAINQRYQGVIELIVIVERDGSIRDIRIVKGLPYGLNAQAIKAVRKWKLSPALAPDGTPTRVRQLIEVTFQLYGP